MGACQSCGAPTSATQKTCDVCGAAAVVAERKGTSLWLGIGSAVAVYALLSITIYLVWSRASSGLEPDDAAAQSIRAALAEQLPAFVRLDSLNLDAFQRDEASSSPAFNITFSGTAVLTSDVYRRSRTEHEVVFLAQEGVEGMSVPLTGAGRLSHTQEGWHSDVSFSPTPLVQGLPRTSFQDHQTIVEGSPEETVYLELRDRAIEEARRQEAVAEAEARQRSLDERREVERLVAEAQQAERARLLLAEQAQAALAEKARIQAERQLQATRDEEARRAKEAALSRQEAQPETTAVFAPTSQVGGRVAKGTKVNVRLSTGLRTDLVAVEDRFTAETVDDIVVRGQVVVPAGATVRGVVASVQAATRTNRRAKLELRFDLLSVGSRSFPMRARAVLDGPGLGRDAVRAGVGAGVGAIIGGLLGGGRGAVLGGVVGGGGAVAATEGQELDLPAGSPIRIEFDSPLDLQ